LTTKQFRIASTSPVPIGENVPLVADFAYDGGDCGKGAPVTISANGKQIDEGRLDMAVPLTYGTDGFAIGGDYGGAVNPDSEALFLFTCRLEQVTIEPL
jgi:hypothetical protein